MNPKLKNLLLGIVCLFVGYLIADPAIIQNPLSLPIGIVVILGVGFLISYLSKRNS